MPVVVQAAQLGMTAEYAHEVLHAPPGGECRIRVLGEAAHGLGQQRQGACGAGAITRATSFLVVKSRIRSAEDQYMILRRSNAIT